MQDLPQLPFNTVMALERAVSRDGMVQYNDNSYSVPDGVRAGAVEIQVSLSEVQIFANGKLVPAHALQEGRHQRRLAIAVGRRPVRVRTLQRRVLSYSHCRVNEWLGDRSRSMSVLERRWLTERSDEHTGTECHGGSDPPPSGGTEATHRK